VTRLVVVCYDGLCNMSYQVIKRFGKRAYQYEVTSFRDPATGKSKGHWTYRGPYLDPVDVRAQMPVPTRERLLDALARLLASTSYAETTVGAIARCAGVTSATFYRHFHDKRSLLFALVERTRDQLYPAAALRASGDAQTERARLKAFIRRVITHAAIRDGVARAIYEMQFKDHAIDAFWRRFNVERAHIFRAYVARLNALRVGYGDDEHTMAAVLTMLAEGVRQVVALRREGLSEAEIELLGDILGRILIK
jgi:AcrR family transcriptional regulator